ncbi:MAG TPA: hypothetical protein VE046_17180 [Steroidobacteraceae bacterium]|nr:hypothetical protein [Steroidobacteraceae bacterium]
MNLQALANEIKVARDRRRPLAPISGRVAGFDIATAYEVADLVHRARLRDGERAVGRKIGFSNRDLWPVFGVTAPVWGYVYDRTVVHLPQSRGRYRIGSLLEARIEPEIVVRFGSAPPVPGDPSAVLASIDWIAHGFEIVESPFPGWKFQASDAIAACALHAALLVGEPRTIGQLGPDVLTRLARFTLTLTCDGKERDRGGGAKVLDSPVAALAHLISVLASQPRAQPLGAGELVTTGTLTGAPLIHGGESWTTALDGIDLPGLGLDLEA